MTTNTPVDVDELLAKAQKPAADAMKLHAFYKGKMETALKCTVRDINDFAIWYTPGVAAPCRDIEANPEQVYQRVKEVKHLFPTGLVISPSHEAILPDVDPANIDAMFEAINEN
jgi:malic enzyme